MSVATTVDAQQNTAQKINSLRIWHSPESTRIVFDISKDVKHSLFRLQNPLRLVVDIEDANLSLQLPKLDSDNLHLANIRTGQPRAGVLRFVFELKKEVKSDSFVLTPNEVYGHRLVIDMTDLKPTQVASDSNTPLLNNEPSAIGEPSAIEEPSAIREPLAGPNENSEPIPIVLAQQPAKKILIAIDAGHGGEDPGATGYRGSKEKKITLAIAKRLKEIIDNDQRFSSYMVRDGDYYIKLNRRREIAHQQNADIFISIHADAFTKSSANGFSVFALSQRGATSTMASALATKENAADLIGGVSLADKDEVLAAVLVDLSMTNTINESVNLGGRVLKELSKLGRLHSKRVEQAGFAVLKSPDIPSILVETGFITNKEEERKLGTSRYQQQIANAIYAAVNEYFEQTPYYNVARFTSPAIQSNAGTLRSGVGGFHTVVRGDSLSKIAEKYKVSLSELKQINGLRSNVAMLGVKLKLPSDAQVANRAQPSSVVTSKPAFHVVKRGDSLSEISAKYNVTIRSIKALNKLSRDTVFLGQKVKIPGGSTTVSATPRKHKVNSGDTLSEIAMKYGSSTTKIMQANNMRSKTVMLGQTLTIPN